MARSVVFAVFQPARRVQFLALVGLLLCLGVAWWRPRWQHARAVTAALEAETLDEGDLSDSTLKSLSAREAQRLWQTGKMGHRRALLGAWVAAQGRDLERTEAWGAIAEQWVREGAVDPDLELRTRSLGALRTLEDGKGGGWVRRALADRDPEVRRLGLQTIRRLGDARQAAWVLPRLDDSDSTLALAADAVLRKWTGYDTGLRLSRILPDSEALVPREVPESDLAAVRAAAESWRRRFPGNPGVEEWDARERDAVRTSRLPAGDFLLGDLRGQPVSLSGLKGRVVLLNFWATWCPACLVELPVLNALQQRHPGEIAVVGICLDSPGGPGSEASETSLTAAEWRSLRNSVGSVAARHRLGYPVLLDPGQRIARRFNGGELPTQVLVDREGFVCRRFVGSRSLPVWEALLQEAEEPAKSRPSGPSRVEADKAVRSLPGG